MDRYPTVVVRPDADLLRVRFDRAHRQNSLTDAVIGDLLRALDRAEESDRCRAVVVEGGDGVFCSGMDLTDAAAPGTDPERGAAAFLGLLTRLTTIPRAVVCVVDGQVSGGGVGLVAASDFTYATPRSTFGLPEALWGLLPCCVLPFLVRRIGFQPASAMTLSTLPVTARRAHEIHLVDDVTDDPEAPLRRLRARLVRVDPATVGDAKAYLRRMWTLTGATEDAAITEFVRLMGTPLVRQRISAFADGRSLPWERARVETS